MARPAPKRSRGSGSPKQTIGPGAVVPKEKWWVAPPARFWRSRARCNRELPGDTTTTTTPPVVAATDEGSGSSVGWIVGGIALAVLVVTAVVMLVRTRRRATAA